MDRGDRYYGRYLEAVVQLQEAMSRELSEPIAPRDVDLALWELGGTEGLESSTA